MKDRDESARLRVVDEEDSSAEEVLRLSQDRERGKTEAEPVARLKPEPESPVLLEAAGTTDERRSLEPDIDTILEGGAGSPDPEEEWKRTRQPVPYGWFVLIALVVVLAVVASTMSGRREEVTDAEAARQAAIERGEAIEVSEREARVLVETVESRIADYLRAGTIEEMLPHVRHRERVEPLMRDWYGRHPLEPSEFRELAAFEPQNLGLRTFWKAMAVCRGPRGERDEAVALLIEEGGGGDAWIDWETAVHYQPMAWDDYVRERPEGAALEFRVMCEPDRDGLYSHEFRNEEVWRGLLLTARDSEDFLIGYLRRGSELEKRIHRLFEGNRWQPLALVLRLSRPEGTASPRGVVIEEVVSPHWLIVDES